MASNSCLNVANVPWPASIDIEWVGRPLQAKERSHLTRRTLVSQTYSFRKLLRSSGMDPFTKTTTWQRAKQTATTFRPIAIANPSFSDSRSANPLFSQTTTLHYHSSMNVVICSALKPRQRCKGGDTKMSIMCPLSCRLRRPLTADSSGGRTYCRGICRHYLHRMCHLYVVSHEPARG